jgi:hypothetical protein
MPPYFMSTCGPTSLPSPQKNLTPKSGKAGSQSNKRVSTNTLQTPRLFTARNHCPHHLLDSSVSSCLRSGGQKPEHSETTWGTFSSWEDALLCCLLATSVSTFNFWVSFALLASFWKEVIEADVSSLGRCGAKGRAAPAGTRLL